MHSLQDYMRVLKVLANQKPMRTGQIIKKMHLDSDIINTCLTLLAEKNLVRKQLTEKGHSIYEITQRGTAVLDFFHEMRYSAPLKNKK